MRCYTDKNCEMFLPDNSVEFIKIEYSELTYWDSNKIKCNVAEVCYKIHSLNKISTKRFVCQPEEDIQKDPELLKFVDFLKDCFIKQTFSEIMSNEEI